MTRIFCGFLGTLPLVLCYTNLLQINHFFQIFLGDIAFLAKHTIQLLVNLFLLTRLKSRQRCTKES